jgi:hypothetical protein
MAIKQVEMLAPVVTTGQSGRKGGGGIGQIVGLLGGAALAGGAAAATGGAALPIAAAAMGGAGGGAALGQLVGEKISPTQASTAMERRATLQQPALMQSEQTQKLRDSVLALHSQPPEIQAQFAPTLVHGYLQSLVNDSTPTGVA